MKHRIAAVALLVLPLVAVEIGAQPNAPRAVAPKSAPSGEGVRWFDGAVDAAFAQARQEQRPLFLYWGAVWCPPCNQVKATVFNRQDFIERSRVFVPVYVDGDAPGAQQLGARFKVSGYPTMILFRPDGTEITRLPGEVDAQQYMQVLALGMSATRPVKELLARATSGKGALSPTDWRLLAYYAWDTDEQSIVPKGQVPATLVQLARRVPASSGDAATRLQLSALAAVATAAEKDRPPIDRAAAYERLGPVLADPAAVRDHFAILSYPADDVLLLLTSAGSPQRARLVAAMDQAFARAAGDVRLSQSDRLVATLTRVQLARKTRAADDKSPLPAALVDTVRGEAARADRETVDRYERQSVINVAAYLLAEAGLLEASDAMLERELARSPAPYYFMQSLGANARRRGDVAGALDWYRQGYETAVGPATRLQWGTAYLRVLIDLAPQDAARIEQAARGILAELEPKPETFHARNAASLNRIGRGLTDWAAKSGQEDVLARLRRQMDGTCARLPAGVPERATCDGILVPKPAST